MSDETMAAQVAALQAQIAAMSGAGQAAAGQAPALAGGWSQPAPTPAAVGITGVQVPVKIETPNGAIRIYLALPAEAAATPQALMGAIEALAGMGIPLDFFGGRDSGGSGWNSGGSSYRRDYRGGYRR